LESRSNLIKRTRFKHKMVSKKIRKVGGLKEEKRKTKTIVLPNLAPLKKSNIYRVWSKRNPKLNWAKPRNQTIQNLS
jgi:hypothetical protein